MKKVIGISILVLILVVASYLGIKKFLNFEKVLTYVTISVNPDFQLAINDDETVVEQTAFDNDGSILLSDIELVGLSIDDAMDKILTDLVDTNYIDEYSAENTVVLTVLSEDDDKTNLLEKTLIENVERLLEDKEVSAVVVARGITDELKAKAEDYGISNGKMLLINQALYFNAELSEDDLVEKSMYQIQQEIKNAVQSREFVKNFTKEQLKIMKQDRVQKKIYDVNQLIESYKTENASVFKNLSEKEIEEKAKDYLSDQKDIAKDEIKKVKESLKNDSDQATSNYIIIKDNTNNIQENIRGQINQQKRK